MIYKTEFQKKAEYGEILMYNNGIHVDANVILKFVDDTLMPRCLVWIESSMRFCGVFLLAILNIFAYLHQTLIHKIIYIHPCSSSSK